jgi:hypothetical protein
MNFIGKKRKENNNRQIILVVCFSLLFMSIKHATCFILLETIMNTDHINNQDENLSAKNHDDTSNYQQRSSPSLGKDSDNQNHDNYQRIHPNSDDNINLLTATERRERMSTLLIIAFIAFLTGKELKIKPKKISYGILL